MIFMKNYPYPRVYQTSPFTKSLTTLNALILWFLILLNAIGCKNQSAQTIPNTALHDLTLLNQKKSKKKPHKVKNHNKSPTLPQTEQIKFQLTDIVLPAGETQSMTLAVLGNLETIVEYTIKSVFVTKNTTTNYSKNFGIDELTNKNIPPSGLTFTIKNTDMQPGIYTLKIKVGKQGKGSKITEQIVSCTITCVENKKANDKPFIEQLKTYSNVGGTMGKIVAGNKGESCGKILGSLAATLNWTYHTISNNLANSKSCPKEQAHTHPNSHQPIVAKQVVSPTQNNTSTNPPNAKQPIGQGLPPECEEILCNHGWGLLM